MTNLDSKHALIVVALALCAAACSGAPKAGKAASPNGSSTATPNVLDDQPLLTKGVAGRSKRRLRIILPTMPPSRTHCSFEPKNGSKGTLISWDPLLPEPLARHVTIRDGVAYEVVCFSELARGGVSSEREYSWRFIGTPSGTKNKACENPVPKPGTVVTIQASTLSSSTPLGFCVQVAENKWELLEGRIDRGNLPEVSLANAPTLSIREDVPQPSISGPRSFGISSDEVIAELFQAIAEVAVEKAKGAGMRVLQEKLRKTICELELAYKRGTAQSPGGQLLLPRTCQVVGSLDLDNIVGEGKQLLTALLSDMTQAAVTMVLHRSRLHIDKWLDGLRPIIEAMVTEALAALSGEQQRSIGAAQRVIAALSRVNLGAMAGNDPALVSAACEVRLALSVVAECQATGGCDAVTIQKMVAEPSEYFTLSGKCADPSVLAAQERREAASLVAVAVRILEPPAGTTRVENLRAALQVVTSVALAEFRNLYGNGTLSLSALEREVMSRYASCSRKGQKAKPCNKSVVRARSVLALRDLVDALIHQRTAAAVAPLATLVAIELDEATNEKFKRLGHVAGSLGAYLSTYTSGREPSEEERARRHEARKQAIEALVDAQTRRGNRLGDSVFSIGAGVYPLIGARYAPNLEEEGEDRLSFAAEPTAVRFGFAYDYHSDSNLGFHLEFMPLDLGQYLVFSNGDDSADGFVPPSALDAVAPSLLVSMSWVFEDIDIPMLFVGPTVSYQPKLVGPENVRRQRSAYFGVALAGAYVPFFDFN